LLKIFIDPLLTKTPLQFSITSLISFPYAPIFCIGALPTFPGIETKFSIPPKLFSIHHQTNLSQLSPAPTETKTSLSSSLIISIPLISIFKIGHSISEVNRILVPAPNINNSFFCFFL